MGNQSNNRPIEKPVLRYVHEDYGNKKADEIHERLTPFAETDAGTRPDFPFSNYIFPKTATFEEYSELLKPWFQMKLENGVLEVRCHTPGHEGFVWNLTSHMVIHRLFEYVNNDHDIEIMIFGGSGENFFETIGPIDEYRDASKPFVPMDDTDPRYNWQLLEHSYIDGTQDIESQVNLSIPLIGVWNGGGFHSDLYFFTDITIATKDAWTTDTHFRLNMVPGDGIQIAWRSLMGIKRFNYAELTGEIITAKKALEYGMINEIEEDVESAYRRAHEIATLIMRSSTRQTRRLTVQIMRWPWRKQIAEELRGSFATEMWNTLSEASPHYPLYWEAAKAQARATKEAESKGKILRPRVGPFIEEDPIV